MKLANFTRYDFIIRDNTLIVKNEKKEILKPSFDRYHYTRKYCLRDDNGNPCSVQELRIAYCLLNHCTFEHIKGKRLTGTVKAPRLKSEKISLPADKALCKVQEIEFCLEKLKHYYLTGDISFFIEYATDSHNKFQAIKTIQALLSAPNSLIDAVYDNAVDNFLDEIQKCSFNSVKPLFGMLCKSLKVSYFRSSKVLAAK